VFRGDSRRWVEHRYRGENKAFLRVGGMPASWIGCLRFTPEIFDEIILVTNHPMEFLEWDAMIVTDLFPSGAPYRDPRGLFYASHPLRSSPPATAPFLKKEIIETVLEHNRPGADLVIPQISVGLEPLCAAYSRRCLKPAEDHLRVNKFKSNWPSKNCRIKKIPEERCVRRTRTCFRFSTSTRRKTWPAVRADSEECNEGGGRMDITGMIAEIRKHPDFHKAGMILCPQRRRARNVPRRQRVKGLRVGVDHRRLEQILAEQRKRPGIIDIRVAIAETATFPSATTS